MRILFILFIEIVVLLALWNSFVFSFENRNSDILHKPIHAEKRSKHVQLKDLENLKDSKYLEDAFESESPILNKDKKENIVSNLNNENIASYITDIDGNSVYSNVPFSHYFEDADLIEEKCTNETSRRICKDTRVCLPSGVCGDCITDNDCQLIFGDQKVCKELSGKKICSHKSLFPRITFRDILSIVITSIGGAMAASSGLGGGGIFVPILIAVGGFSSSLAIPISKSMIFGASIANFILFIMRKHPLDKRRPIIDFDSTIILEPATLLGTIVGVLLNVFLPEIVILIMLIILLGITTIRTFHKGIKAFRAESSNSNQKKKDINNNPLETIHEDFSEGIGDEDNIFEQESDEDSGSDISDDALFDMMMDHGNPSMNAPKKKIEKDFDTASELIGTDPAFLNTPGAIPPDSAHARLVRLNQRIFPFEKILALVACWFIILTTSLLKGGHGSPSIVGINNCSILYWILTSIPFPTIGFIMFLISAYLIVQNSVKTKHRVPFLKGDVKWNILSTTFYPLLSFLAGASAGSLGVGGGLIKGPILIEMGLLPEVVVATSSFMILFTSSITTVQFVILSRLPLDYGIVFMVIGFISAFIGQIFSEFVIKKLQRPSVFILIMGFIILISTILMAAVGIYRFIEDLKLGFGFAFVFGTIC